jgi:hypothetical protein
MNRHQPPKVALLLTRLLPHDCEALVGDLVEDYQAGRSPLWFWRQVVVAIGARAIARSREPLGGFVTVENASASLAMFVVLAFEVIVAATLLDQIFSFASFEWVAGANSEGLATALLAASFLVAFVAAFVLARVGGGGGRMVVAIGSAASAILMAFITLHLAHPLPPRPFLPSAPVQLGTATVFMAGLLAGFRLRRRSNHGVDLELRNEKR